MCGIILCKICFHYNILWLYWSNKMKQSLYIHRWTWKWKLLSHVWPFSTVQSMGFSRPEYWREWPFPSPGDLTNPGIEPRSPALQADSSPAEPLEAQEYWSGFRFIQIGGASRKEWSILWRRVRISSEIRTNKCSSDLSIKILIITLTTRASVDWWWWWFSH